MTRVLDIGAGTAPHPRATDAVDLHSPRALAAIARQERRRIPETVAYRYNVNMNESLPYAEKVFSTVVSQHSIGTFGRAKAFKEAFRVLKPGGKLQVRIGDPRNVRNVTAKIQGAGFEKIAVRVIPLKGQMDPDVEITARKPNPVVNRTQPAKETKTMAKKKKKSGTKRTKRRPAGVIKSALKALDKATRPYPKGKRPRFDKIWGM
ncbi:MAG: class I SAM-dependent methyltransferase [Bacteroidales bacterium]|jgi:ubiquinone/menaquinone biosynthesis C-methylase UbiE